MMWFWRRIRCDVVGPTHVLCVVLLCFGSGHVRGLVRHVRVVEVMMA